MSEGMIFTLNINHFFHFPQENEVAAKLDNMADSIVKLKEFVEMATSNEVESLKNLTAKVDKIFGEVSAFKEAAASNSASMQAAIEALEVALAQVSAGSPDVAAQIQILSDKLDATDGLIADLPTAPV